ncbi:MAG: hypothetical protein MMC23_003654 [Stictis urceolatum]|nr:hypothetical protein [Stictis urceolata]
MGLRCDLEKRGCKIREYTFWAQDSSSGAFSRTNIGPDVITPTAYPWTLAIDKGDLEQILIDDLVARGHKIEYHAEHLSFSRPTVGQQITAHVKHYGTGVIETWYTSYILGCDGSESLVRRTLGIELQAYGELEHWAIADVSATTDFPDHRRRSTIRSQQGNCVLTPRNSSEFRIRTQLSSEDLKSPYWSNTHITDQVSPINHTASSMGLAAALQMRICAALAPYKFSMNGISWIDQYPLQKTLARQFADPTHSVFLLGSAAHTHSPLTKQAINSGMMDALNITWKLTYVIRGSASRTVLASYQAERRALLVKAIEFDCMIDHMFAIRSNEAQVYTGFHDFEEASGYTSGCGARYPASDLVKEEKRLFLIKSAEALTPGKRLLPGKVLRHLDGNEVNVLEILGARGNFSLIYFAGDTLHAPIMEGASNLLKSEDSPLNVNSLESGLGYGKTLEVLLIHCVLHTTIPIEDMRQPWPQHSMNIFEDVAGRYHTTIGLSPKLGGLCLVRPDGYLAIITNLDNGDAITEYFTRMRERSQPSTSDSSTVLGDIETNQDLMVT